MDPTTLIPLISGGGPTALIAVLAVFIMVLRRDLRDLQKEFHEFQIAQIANSATKTDLAAINATLNQIFDLLREQNHTCGRDCAAMQQI
ncbi:MAG: hypothetical protein HQM00_17595, partial [Magnetococcales bacterium]|nr:hypothetical protein [Magnetococcales bacterium]